VGSREGETEGPLRWRGPVGKNQGSTVPRILGAFSHSDFTVGPGFSPESTAGADGLVPRRQQGHHHRSGLGKAHSLTRPRRLPPAGIIAQFGAREVMLAYHSISSSRVPQRCGEFGGCHGPSWWRARTGPRPGGVSSTRRRGLGREGG
jgi:hypothetical protein